MTDTRLLRQPIEGALFIGQQFVDRGYNHDWEVMFTTPTLYCRLEIYFTGGAYNANLPLSS
jgi:hypothetical protein